MDQIKVVVLIASLFLILLGLDAKQDFEKDPILRYLLRSVLSLIIGICGFAYSLIYLLLDTPIW